MKKLLNSLPSTKPDVFYESQPTFASNYETQPKSYQYQLQNVINQLKKIHRYRTNLLPRDLQQIFKTNINIFVDLLSVTTSDQLWHFINPNQERQLNEHIQLGLLLAMLLQMNKSKYRCADLGNIKKFDDLRTVIQWFIPQIVLFQTHLRQKIQQQIISSCQEQRKKRQLQFHQYQQSTKRQFAMMEDIRVQNLNRKINQDKYHKEYQIKDKIANNMHRIRASSELRHAKDNTLLRKLAPYKWDKKRIYEDSTYKQTIDDILENDDQRRLRVIENMKKVQKQKLKRVHDNLISTQEMRASIQRDRMMISLTNQRTQFQNNEEKRLKNLKHSIDMANNIKINHLKKSLQAFSRHQDTLKIKQIMSNHHYKAQFNQQIQEIAKPEIQIQKMNNRYLTIHSQKQNINPSKNLNRHQIRLQKHIQTINGEHQQMRRSMGNSGRQKSIIDFYDKQLNLIV